MLEYENFHNNDMIYNMMFLRSITMTWIALGHMYMFAIEYPVIFGESSPFVTKNRGDCEKVHNRKIYNL